MTIAPYAWEAQGVFATPLYTPRRCASLVAQVRKTRQWNDAEIVVDDRGTSQANPASRSARILHGSAAVRLGSEFEGKIQEFIRPILRKIWDVNLAECSGTQLVRYKPGGHYVPHVDVGAGELANRYFTVLCYLNQDFEGGKTSFPSLNYTATPATGKAIVFPANYLHCAEPVARGEKLILLTWVCGPVPVPWI